MNGVKKITPEELKALVKESEELRKEFRKRLKAMWDIRDWHVPMK